MVNKPEAMSQTYHGVVVQAMKQALSMSFSIGKATYAAQHHLRSCASFPLVTLAGVGHPGGEPHHDTRVHRVLVILVGLEICQGRGQASGVRHDLHPQH